MGWNFENRGATPEFTYAYAAPAEGETETFEVDGWEVAGSDFVRSPGVSIQLAGSSTVEYLDRNGQMQAEYLGFSDTNIFTGQKGLRPPGLCRSTAGAGLEYLCLLPLKRQHVLDFEIFRAPQAIAPGSNPPGFVVLDGAVTVGSRTYAKLESGILDGDLGGDGVIVAAWLVPAPMTRRVPAVPERMDPAVVAANPGKFDMRTHSSRGIVRPTRPGGTGRGIRNA